jgi:peptidoglycan hydrolase CwlO-like protein
MNKQIKKVVIFCFLAFFVASVFLPAFTTKVKAEDSIEDLQDEEKKLQSDLKKAELLYGKLSQQYQQIQGSISAVQSEISKTAAKISKTKEEINRKEGSIKETETRLEFQKKILENLVRELYYAKKSPEFGLVMVSDKFSEVLSGIDNISVLEEQLLVLVGGIKEDKSKLETEKEELARIKAENEKILALKQDQHQDLLSDKNETAGDMADQQKIIDRLKKELAELQGDLSALTGKSYNAKDIREAVEFASKKTGVPEGVLYGFLKKETNLGANTGQCTYDQVVKVSEAKYKKYGSKYKASIALLYKRQGIFLEIVKTLGYSKDKKVSCSPSAYIGQGGAMGVSQFMSDVWRGYEPQIKSMTGNSKPDPWGLTDGVMAMALKLKKAGATSSSPSAIKSASINYLGTFNANYYNGIVYWSKNYKLLFQ